MINYIIDRQKVEICMYRQKLEDLKMGLRTALERGNEMIDTLNANLENSVHLKDEHTQR